MENSMLNEFRELFQTFILPQFEGLKGDMRALEAKIGALDSKIGSIDTKVESFRRELLSDIHRVEQVLSTDFVRLEQKIDLRFAAMDK
jgi:hypothetical protein